MNPIFSMAAGLLLTAGLLTVGVLAVPVSSANHGGGNQGGPPGNQGGPPPAKVAVKSVAKRQFTSRLEVLGEVEAIRESRLGVEVEGLVKSLLVDEGTRVETGQVLLGLKTVRLGILKRRAEVELKHAKQQLLEYQNGSRPEVVREAEAAVAEAKELQQEAERELKRIVGLRQDNVASEKEHTSAVTEAMRTGALLRRRQAILDLIKAGPRAEVIERAESQVAIREAGLAMIEDEIAKASLKAPFAGVITDKHVEVGQYMDRGEDVLTLVQMDPIRVSFAVPEHAIDRVRIGMEARFTLDAMPQKSFTGKVEAIVPRADELARTFPVKIRLPNPDSRILPGMAARAVVELAIGPAVLAVSSDAIVRTPLGSSVYVVRGGTAVRVDVRPGRMNGEWVEVAGELREGEKVVVRGNETLRPGQRVQVLASERRKAPGESAAPKGNGKH